MRRAAVNKELAEGYLLNRAHRMEVRDQSRRCSGSRTRRS